LSTALEILGKRVSTYDSIRSVLVMGGKWTEEGRVGSHPEESDIRK